MKKKIKDIKFKKIIIWILVVLLIITGFCGIYARKLNKLANIIPDYNFGMDIKGNREYNLVIDDSENEKSVYVDEEGNIVGEVNGEQEAEGYTIETKKVKANNEENLTVDNYKKTKEIIEKRLKKLSLIEYNLKLNNENGNIVIELPQNENTDNYYAIATMKGKFEIVDKQTGIVLMDNEDIIKISPVTNQSTSGFYEVDLKIEFNEIGAKKLRDISNKYIEYKEEGTEEIKREEVSFKLDETTLYSTCFHNEATSNIYYMPIAEKIVEQEELQANYNIAQRIADIVNIGDLPIKYYLESDEFIKSTINDKNIKMFKGIFLGCLILIILIFAIKYKVNGLKFGIVNLGFVSIYSLVIRYLNVEINLPGFISIVAIIIINLSLYYNILKNNINNKDFNKKFKEFNISIIPFIIIAIVFTLTQNINTLSIGMLTFWGIAIFEIYNLLVLKTI